MPTAPWNAVKALFDRVVELSPSAREAALRDEPDVAVAAEVRSLLAHADTGNEAFLQQPAALTPVPERSREGERLRPWRLGERLGIGGMGDVWLARRDDGAYEGEAAVKLLRRGMDSAAVLARFAQEQQALARLTHPHIAHLLDAGRTADGLPYFVMERVHGVPIDKACEGLPLERRLALFLQLADAVSHAHRNLLVHRDLKPSNVLVVPDSGVKLLDFGIAKALDPREGADAGQTQAGERPYTPHYASPEQVRGEPVSTATDIYSLGVLLYVMLTGLRPYGRSATTPHEAARSVLEEEPTRPSALSPGLVADPQWMATRKRLRGDLDNILLKALDKTVSGRYPSVDALAADVRAYLDGYPVSARNPGWGYRVGKFVRRNRVASLAAAVAVLALVGGTTVALWQAREAERERALAQRRFTEVRQLAGQLVFKYHDQLEYLQGATAVREAILGDAAVFLDSLRDAATEDTGLAHELSGTYYRISLLQGVSQAINTGQHARAEANLDKAIALQAGYVGRPGTSTEALADAVDMRVSKGELRQRLGRMNEAVQIIREALPLLEPALARQPQDYFLLTSAIGAHGALARMLGTSVANANLGRLDEAREHVDAALRHARQLLAPSPDNVESLNSHAFALGERGNWLAQTGDVTAAVAAFTEQTAIRDRNAASKPDDAQFRQQRVTARGNLAGALGMAGRHAEARRTMDEGLALAAQLAAADPGNQAAALRLQTLRVLDARLLALAGDVAAARKRIDAVLAAWPQPAPAEFVTRRWRAEALLWAARTWRTADARRALAHADEAAALMEGRDENAARAWMHALALGERALAQAALGGASAARAADSARVALQAWADSGPVPGSFERFVEPVRALAR